MLLSRAVSPLQLLSVSENQELHNDRFSRPSGCLNPCPGVLGGGVSGETWESKTMQLCFLVQDRSSKLLLSECTT